MKWARSCSDVDCELHCDDTKRAEQKGRTVDENQNMKDKKIDEAIYKYFKNSYF